MFWWMLRGITGLIITANGTNTLTNGGYNYPFSSTNNQRDEDFDE